MEFLKSIPAFPVLNIEDAVEFYSSKLGFENIYSTGSFARVKRGEIMIDFWKSNDKSWKFRSIFLFLKPVKSGAESFIAGTHSCKIEMKGVEDLYNEVKDKKILHKKHKEIKITDWGTKEFHILDLYGNLITFYENIKI
ncbi:MAG TPA: bleomycin resistance family protein [Ignavibacteria bacterium]|nr:bleomycin resistance family protein [Ignavibacteria bacterium]